MPVAGIEVVGLLPADLQRVTIFSAGVPAGATQPEAAKDLARFLASTRVGDVLAKHGLESAAGVH
jgi:molybdate transport system substrate-binding protein